MSETYGRCSDRWQDKMATDGGMVVVNSVVMLILVTLALLPSASSSLTGFRDGSEKAWPPPHHSTTSGSTSTLTWDQLESTTLTEEQVESTILTGDQVESTTLTWDQVDFTTLTGEQVESTTLTGDHVESTTLTEDQVESTTLTEDQVESATLTENQVESSTLTEGQVESTILTEDQVQSSTLTEGQVESTILTEDQVESTTLTEDQVESTSLTEDQVESTTLTGEQMESTTLTEDQVESTILTENQVESTTLTGEQVESTMLTEDQVESTTLTEGQVESTTLTGEQVESTTLTGEQVESTTLTGDQVESTTLTKDQVESTTLTGDQRWYGCVTQAGGEVVKEAREEGSDVPQECLELVCSQPSLVPLMDPGGGPVIYWLRGHTSTCYSRLPTSPQVGPSPGLGRVANLTSRVSVVVLWPECIQTSGVAMVQATPPMLDALPFTCHHSLCHSGAELYELSLATYGISPRPTLGTKNEQDCFQALAAQAQHHNTSETPLKTMLVSMTLGPAASPCPTLVAVTRVRPDQQVLLVLPGWWCSPLSVAEFQEVVLTWPAATHTGSGHHLYTCLLAKSRLWPSVYNHYLTFLHDLLYPNLTIFNLPQVCVTFFCHPTIDISYITQVGKLTRLWFPYLAFCHGSACLTLRQKLSQCQADIGVGRDVSEDGAIMLPLPHPGPGAGVAMTLSAAFWCEGGSGRDSMGRSRADLVSWLAMESTELLVACKEMACQAELHALTKHTTIAVLPKLSSNQLNFCQSFVSVSYHDHRLTIFSLTLNTTGKEVIFFVGQYPLELTTQKFLATLHTAALLHLTTCCPGTPLMVSKFIFINQTYYACSSTFPRTTLLTCPLESNQLWFRQQLAVDTYLTVMNMAVVPFRTLLFFHWLASIPALNSTTTTYVLNKKFSGFLFRDNIIYIFREHDTFNLGLVSLFLDLEVAGLVCSSSPAFTLCYSTTHFPAPQLGTVVVAVLHQCSIRMTDEDSVLLLVLTRLRKPGLTEAVLCGGNDTVVMVSGKEKRAVYSSRGSQRVVATIMQELQAIAPEWTWQRDEDGLMWDFIRRGWCMQIRQLQRARAALGTITCIYYIINGTTVLIGPSNKNSYHVIVFPLIPTLQSQPTFIFPSSSPAPLVLPLMGTVHLPPTTLRLQVLAASPVQINKLPETGDPQDLVMEAQTTVKTMMTAALRGDKQCLQDIHHGTFTVTMFPHMFVVGPVETDLVESSCLLSLPEFILVQMLVSQQQRNLTTINKFWPTCRYNLVVVMGAGTGMILDWEYLSSTCQAAEILLLTFAIVVVLTNLAGNMLVLVVILSTSLVREATFLLRASLAIADLLLGLVPGILAVYDHLALMTGHLALHHLAQGTLHASFARLAARQSPGFRHLRFERGGLPMVSSTLFNVSVTVSVLTLLLLSLERLSVVAGRPMRHRLVIVGVDASWVVGVLLSILVHWRQDGLRFAGYFDPITKLTVTVGAGAPSVSLAVFYTEVGVLAVASGAIVVCTVATLCLLIHKEWKTQTMLTVHSKRREEEVQRTTYIFLAMVFVSGMAGMVLLLDLVLDLPIMHPLAHYFAWWLFMAAASSNWALYSCTGGKFRKNLAALMGRQQVGQRDLTKAKPKTPG